MNPRTSDDRLLAWAGKTKIPILSLDYAKAPQYPYPFAMEECYDAYRAIVETRGHCLGLSGDVLPHIVVPGDSAGGNLAVRAWITDEQVAFVQRNVDSRKKTPADDTAGQCSAGMSQPCLYASSMIAYMDDRILTADIMRALVLFYIGSCNVNLATDCLLSPILAPTSLLARFPRTYMITGERDPMVDDTMIFANRLRQAKLEQFAEGLGVDLDTERGRFNDVAHVEVPLSRGISHGWGSRMGFCRCRVSSPRRGDISR